MNVSTLGQRNIQLPRTASLVVVLKPSNRFV
jgi:hypothetical protein